MVKLTMRCAVGLPVALLVVAVGSSVGSGDPPAKGEPAKVAKELIGTWVLVGTPEKVGEPPASGGRLKFFTGRHWCITQADPKTGKVTFHHGGTYTLDGDTFAETVEYAHDNTAGLIGKTFKFKIKLDGDTLTQIGDGNPYQEVWKRVK